MSIEEIRVRPTGWKSAPEEEQFVVSDMDNTMPKIYVQIVEVFNLAPDSEKPMIVHSMVKGLEYALDRFSILTGGLKMDAENGRLWVIKKRNSSVGLSIQDVAESYPSYEELEKSDFPAMTFKGHKLLPKAVTVKQLFSPLGDNQEDDTIMSTFQINFIEGGLVLGVAIHHNCSERPDAARWKQLDQKFPVLKDAGGTAPRPSAGFKMPEIVILMWHLPKSKTKELKSKAMPQRGTSLTLCYFSITPKLKI